MTKRGQFLIYCVETYKNAKHLTGRPLAAVKLLPSIRMRMAFPRFFGSWGVAPLCQFLPAILIFPDGRTGTPRIAANPPG